MNIDEQAYHRERALQCRSMAELASDPDIRRRHEELAALHATRAAQSRSFANRAGGSATA